MPHMVIVLFTAKTPLAKYFYKLFLTNVTFWNHAVPCSTMQQLYGSGRNQILCEGKLNGVSVFSRATLSQM